MSSCGFGFVRTSAPISRFVSSNSEDLDMLTPDDHKTYPTHDLKWGEIVGFAATNQVLEEFKNLEIGAIADNFNNNIQRIKSMLVTPTLIGDLTMDIQRCVDFAEFTVTKTMRDPIIRDYSMLPNDVTKLADHLFHTNNNEMFEAQEQGGDRWQEFYLASLNRGTQPVIMLQGTPSATGLEAMLSSALTGTWTAFETMAGDLWETALNLHPAILAELRGKKKRDGKTEPDPSEPSESLRHVQLSEVLRYQFDLRNKMGSVHRNQRRFDNLTGIREAYRLAFSKDAVEIDRGIDYNGLDALNAVRNLIVHRAGIVDREYKKRAGYLKIPDAAIGNPILLDGQITMEMMISVIKASFHLVESVDKWIAEN
jgi:hypothetical protein